jgi:type IV pilus assembly protein PilY1
MPLSRSTLMARALRRFGALALLAGAAVCRPAAAIDLADTPLFSTYSVPGNLALALSVEWPTATTPAYPSTTAYSPTETFLGYFDPAKCYRYLPRNTGSAASPDYSTSYFEPHSQATGHTCRSTAALPLWSGNYLNWASMQTLDAFRWVLTGGFRSVDTNAETILTKTYAARDVVTRMPQKKAEAKHLDGATPFRGAQWSAGITSRLRNLGVRMWVTSSNVGFEGTGTAGAAVTGAVPYTAQSSHVNDQSPDYANPAQTYEVYINVRVCDARAGLEENCIAYGSNHKPEGLMQAYASKLRYSAFGYYNDSSGLRDGGVMRARMKFIGPTRPVPGAPASASEHPEWDPRTGIMAVNPDTGDADATRRFAASAGWDVAIANSGVMNYLNKFGNEARSYKSVDPVSELYYAVQRYFRGLGNVNAYTSLAGAGDSATAAQWLDGFPAITSDSVWKSKKDVDGTPIAYTCQKNFILGIGDINTHRDTNLPGSTIRSKLEPDLPSEVSSDSTVDVKKATDMVGKLEGLSNGATLGALYSDSGTAACEGARCNSYLIAGLAYQAHTVDIRADLDDVQTIDTYWMDVLEKQVYAHKNPYWLAAKYGGFEVPKGFSPYAAGNGPSTLPLSLWYRNGDTLALSKDGRTFSYSTDGSTDERPDNYFPGDRPETMKLGLTRAFADIVGKTDAARGTALSTASPNVTSAGTVSYSSTYSPEDWTGDLIASAVGFDKDGVPTQVQAWQARDVLEKMVGDKVTSSRKIVTCCTASGNALPFTASSLTSTRLASRTAVASFDKVPGARQQSAANFVAYLRGDRSQELSKGGAYRDRNFLLGDIVNSKPVAVGAPSARYLDTANPGYSSFKRERAKRQTVVYVGANDGMLHAFDGSTGGSDSGKELFAYIPSFVYGSASTAADRGLAALGNPSYSHRFFVDATPQVFDVDMARTGKQPAKGTKWRSLLVSGLGKGGNGYFAIDVTDPTEWTGEGRVAEKVLWEFTDGRMGYSYGAASVVKTRKYGWTVVLTSGYDNSDGKGWFFFVDPATGELLEAVATPEGSTAEPLNLAHHSAFIPDATDFTADAIYAADLRGNVWRLDVTGTGNYTAPAKLAKLTNASGTAQPVTTRPLTEIEPNTKKRYIMIGTGRLLADSDIKNGDLQSFYALVDGNAKFGGFFADGAPGTGFPFVRKALQPNPDLVKGIGSAPASALGWYFDLSSEDGIAERIDVQSVANNGVVAFAANLPTGAACKPDGSGRIFTTTFATGKTVLVGDDGVTPVASVSSKRVVRDLAIQRVNGRLQLYGGDSGGNVVKVPAALSGGGTLRQLGWREVKTAE